VRYRYDAARKKRIKTAELVVAESDWKPRFASDELVGRVHRCRDLVVALGLRRRIVTLRHPVLDAAALSEKHPDADAGPAST
jgi:hypothetical protein